MSTTPLWERLTAAVPPDAWPARGATVVLGVSGGADSVALLRLMHAYNTAESAGWRLHVAHLDHGLRGVDSAGDAAFVADLAADLGCTVTIGRQAVPLATQPGTLEEAARSARYAFFERVLEEVDATVVATAHHWDDNVETLLQRLLRGTGLRGLSGIPAARPLRRGHPARVIRPLLDIRGAELRDYLAALGQPFRDDATNRDTTHTRNRLRLDLLPLLERDYQPGVRGALARLGQQCRWLQDYLDDVVGRRFADTARRISTTEVVLSCKALLREPVFLQHEIVRRAVTVVGARERRLGFQHYQAAVDLAGRRVSGKMLELPDGLRIAKRRDDLSLSIAAVAAGDDR